METKNTNQAFVISLILSLVFGSSIALIDTSKNWNDTGITVFLVLISSVITGFIKPRYAWLWAIIIGGIIFSFNAIKAGNYGSALVFAVAFVGSYVGVMVKKIILNRN